MNQLATTALEGHVIDGGEQRLWLITKGDGGDYRVLGPFAGTKADVATLVAELNARDAANIHFRSDGYDYEETDAIRTADDILIRDVTTR